MQKVYLDNCATTKPCERAVAAALSFMSDSFYNPSAAYKEGRDTAALISRARQTIAGTINADPGEVYFTSGGTESVNTALFGVMQTGKKGVLLLSCVEHPAAENAAKHLESRGIEVRRAPMTNGGLDLSALEELLSPEVKLVSFMAVNNETGYIFPLGEIRRLMDRICPDAFFHVDAVQAYGKIPLDFKSQRFDLLSLSAHKIHGPKGIGALLVKKGLHPRPLLFGGGQEDNFRSGTENTPGIAGFHGAAEFVFGDVAFYREKLFSLRALALSELKKSGLRYVLNSPENGAPHILNVALPGIPSQVIVNYLDSKGVLVSAGSACSARKMQENRVLLNSNISPDAARCAVRISFGAYNEESDVDLLIGALRDCQKELKLS